MLELLKKEANKTVTENGALTYGSTSSGCLDLFATVGALRCADEKDIINRFLRAYTENGELAMKTLFFARDIRGGLGERRVFCVIFRWLADHEPGSVRKNIPVVAEYGRYDDLLSLMGTSCEQDMLDAVRIQFEADMAALGEGREVSLLAKWLPSVNASNAQTVKAGKKVARALGMNDALYRKGLSALRAKIGILENYLREKDYSFEYEKQPGKALYRYRKAFLRNDQERYQLFMAKADNDPAILHTGTIAPYDIIAPLVDNYSRNTLPEKERKVMNTIWNALEDFAGSENALAVVDGSGSMYWGGNPLPAAVALSLGIYFAERNKGIFHNHFITFSNRPQLVGIKGRDIVEKVRYCRGFQDCSNTDLQKTFELVLRTAVNNHVPQEEMPAKLYIISDMEFDCCSNAGMTNFEYARKLFADYGYKLPEVVFWNVQSRNIQQPVKSNDQGVVLVSGCSTQVFSMLKKDILTPYSFMLEVLGSERYGKITA